MIFDVLFVAAALGAFDSPRTVHHHHKSKDDGKKPEKVVEYLPPPPPKLTEQDNLYLAAARRRMEYKFIDANGRKVATMEEAIKSLPNSKTGDLIWTAFEQHASNACLYKAARSSKGLYLVKSVEEHVFAEFKSKGKDSVKFELPDTCVYNAAISLEMEDMMDICNLHQQRISKGERLDINSHLIYKCKDKEIENAKT